MNLQTDLKNDKIAIIVPVFNCKRYIRKCLRSIIRQSYPNWIIVAVDDGSTDGTSEILDQFINIDDRIKVIHQKNRGCIEARKVGVTSKYTEDCKWVTFCDADDILPESSLEIMYNAAMYYQVDLVCGRMDRIWKGIKVPYNMPDCFKITAPQIYEHETFIEKLFIGYFGITNFPVQLWGKLYRKTYIQRAVCSTPKVVEFFGEDLCVTINVVSKVNNLAIIPNVVYLYRVGGGTTKVTPQEIDDFVALYEYKKRIAQNFSMPYDVQHLMDVEMINIAMSYFKKCFKQQNITKENMVLEIKRVCSIPVIKGAAARLTKDRLSDEHAKWIEHVDVERIIRYSTETRIKEKVFDAIKDLMFHI